jgi:predicted nucleic acid-binding protein
MISKRGGMKAFNMPKRLTCLQARVSDPHVRPNIANPIDLALPIAELHDQSDSAVLALALEAKASTLERRDRALMLARTFQIRGIRVAEVTAEVPLKLSLPIATKKTKGVKLPRILRGMLARNSLAVGSLNNSTMILMS